MEKTSTLALATQEAYYGGLNNKRLQQRSISPLRKWANAWTDAIPESLMAPDISMQDNQAFCT